MQKLNLAAHIGGLDVDSHRRFPDNEPRDANVRFAAYEALGLLPVEEEAAFGTCAVDFLCREAHPDIRRRFDKTTLPIVMVTTQNETQDNAILHKPFTAEDLGKVLTDLGVLPGK